MMRKQLIWNLFSRANPVYAPQRRAATAQRWAQAAAYVCRYLYVYHSGSTTLSLPPETLQQWAARFVLDGRSAMELPPEYCPCGDGSCRRNAMDAGGIEGQVLLSLAHIVLGFVSPPTDQKWKAWSILYPQTAALHSRMGMGPFEYDHFASMAEAAIEEWELIQPDAADWLQIETAHLTEEDSQRLSDTD